MSSIKIHRNLPFIIIFIILMPYVHGNEIQPNNIINNPFSLARFSIKSAGFDDNREIPVEYTCHGSNISPELTWKNAPKKTKSYVLIVDDPDVSGANKVWDHWILFNIPPTIKKFPKGIKFLPKGVGRGLNSFGKLNYMGPCSADRRHRYYFTLIALDARLDLPDGVSKEQILLAMKGHVLSEAEMIGLYGEN